MLPICSAAFFVCILFGLVPGGVLLWKAVREAVVYFLLRKNGTETTAYVSRLRRTSSSRKSSTSETKHYMEFSYRNSDGEYLNKEQRISAYTYRQIKAGNDRLQVRYLPDKPTVYRLWEQDQPIAVAVGVAFNGGFGLLAIGFCAHLLGTSSNLFVPPISQIPGIAPIVFLAVVGVVALGGAILYFRYAPSADLGTDTGMRKAKPRPTENAYQSLSLSGEDDPFALVTIPEKPKGTPAKPKRDSGFTPLDDDTDHPLV